MLNSEREREPSAKEEGKRLFPGAQQSHNVNENTG